MNAAIAAPDADLSPYAPRIEKTKINPDKIGELIGPGGKNIKAIQAETGADISIQDDGTVHIYSANQPRPRAALSKSSTTSSPKSKSAQNYTAASSARRTSARSWKCCPGRTA